MWTDQVPGKDCGFWVLAFSPVKLRQKDFPGGAVVKNLPANARDTGLMPGLGRSHMLWSN